MTVRSQLAKDSDRRIHQCYGARVEINLLKSRKERERKPVSLKQMKSKRMAGARLCRVVWTNSKYLESY